MVSTTLQTAIFKENKMFSSNFICEKCGKAMVMYRSLSGGFYWKCPDDNCESNKDYGYQTSNISGV